jgi:hypothetical protein
MWSARGENKNLKKFRKDMVQSEFKQQMGLLIDVVKQGFGTTNDLTLLISSDPYISYLKPKYTNVKLSSMFPEALQLLITEKEIEVEDEEEIVIDEEAPQNVQDPLD